MQRGVADGDTAHKHGLEARNWRNGAGAPNLKLNIPYQRGCFLSGKLVGHGPARGAGVAAQFILQFEAVNFDHGTVNFIVERRALAQQSLGIIQKGLLPLHHRSLGI